jgi:hypothetical protein
MVGIAHEANETSRFDRIDNTTSSDREYGELRRVMFGLLTNTDVPRVPPRTLRSGAPVGLELLDLILQPLHVRRITERLIVAGTTHLDRSLTVDVSLSRLTTSQLRSAERYSDFRSAYVVTELSPPSADAASSAGGRPAVGADRRLWLPVLEVSRQETAPAEVTDASGKRVPRAPQSEILPLLTAALVNLFDHETVRLRENLDNGAAALLYIVRHDAENVRWLIHLALEKIIRHGLSSFKHQNFDPPSEPPPDGPIREMAKAAVGLVLDGGVFSALLQLTATTQFIVVGVDRSESDQSFLINTPRLQIGGGAVRRRTSVFGPHLRVFFRHLLRSRIVRGAMPEVLGPVPPRVIDFALFGWRRVKFELKCYQTMTLRYVTHLPPGSTSYHLHVATEDDLNIESALLISDGDLQFIEDLGRRAAAVVGALAELPADLRLATPQTWALIKTLLMEAERSATQLNGILENRTRRLRSIWGPLVDSHDFDLMGLQRRAAVVRAELRKKLQLMRDPGRHVGSGAGQQAAGARRLGRDLCALLDECKRLEVGRELTSDDDPEESEAHVHRRERRDRPRGTVVGPETATVLVAIRENTPALRGRVLMTVGPLALIVYVIGTFLYSNPLWLVWPAALHHGDRQADALITILLLVPGLLITRLDIARGSSLLAVIRSLPRLAAFGSVASTTLLAASIAAGAHGAWLRVLMSLTFIAVVVFLLVQLIDVRATRWAASNGLSLDPPSAPAWLLRPGIRARAAEEIDIDVRSYSDGSEAMAHD